MKFICYPKCSTCKKAEKWLKEKGIEFTVRDIKEEKPSEEELTAWINASGKPVKKFFNTSGLKYKELNLKDKLKDMSDEEMIKLLASDGMLVKRPVGVMGEGADLKVCVGFKETEWENIL